MQVSERRDMLRDRLVGAAEAVISGQGLPGLKARDLAQEAGCSVGAIYNVFPDLDGLILAVNLRTLALFEAAIADSRAQAGPDDGSAVTAADELVRLALAYLAFAHAHGPRWRALFQHRMAGGAVPESYRAEQGRLFSYIEAPLARLCPRLSGAERSLRARTLFSSTHGIVSLGLDEKLLSLPRAVLAGELEALVRAAARGLAAP